MKTIGIIALSGVIDKEKLKIGLSIKELEGTSSQYGYEEYR